MKTQRFIIDTDTASDDAVAILMALQWPDVELEAITVVFGNVSVEQGSINARYTVELCRQSTPVYEGAAKGLLREPTFAHWFHGSDGMGEMGYQAPKSPPAEGHAVDELIRRFGQAPGEISLITLGPLTNIALALLREPQLAHWVKECYVMGGNACTVGNVTPAAEFNIWCDPEAAKIVFHSGMKVLMVGWEHCRGEANLDDDEREMVYGFDTELARFTIDCNRNATRANQELFGEPGLPFPDPITVAIALDPAVCTERSLHFVDISCDELTRGMTVVDQLGVTGKEVNVEVCWQIDIPLWKETLYRTLK
jgi:purine nucleosidase